MKNHYVWVGVRETDILYTGNLFCGSITMFGSGTGGNLAWERECGRREDHNRDIPAYTDFVRRSMEAFLARDPEVRIVHYASLDFLELPVELYEHGFACNAHGITLLLEEKLAVKRFLLSQVPVLPWVLLPGSQCKPDLLEKQFPGSKAWVAQGLESCGGANTVYLDESGSKVCLQPEEPYCVSVYQEQSVPVNFHAIIYQDTVLLMPPSVQIINHQNGTMHYQGADFSVYGQLTSQQQALAKKTAIAVGQQLRKLGYRGVCGIDLLLTQDQCYFMEVNPRFQASTVLLNRSLLGQGFPSVHQYHLEAFTTPRPGHDAPETAEGSFYIYEYSPPQADHLRWHHHRCTEGELSRQVEVWDDGLCWESALDPHAYLFKLVFDRALSCITLQNTVRLHPNVTLPEPPGDVDTYDGLLRLKLLLLCRGIEVSSPVWQQIAQEGGVDWEEFEAITMLLRGQVWITAPCRNFWEQLSPLSLQWQKDGPCLLALFGRPLLPVVLQKEDPLASRRTGGGHRYGEIAYLNPDRLRMFAYSGCAMRSCGKGCRFCDLYGPEQPFSQAEIYEVLDAYLGCGQFRHVLIGGGSHLPAEDVDAVIRMARSIQAIRPQDIYYMGLPIPQETVLQELRQAGVTEVAFNVEVFDRKIALELMPAKGAIPLETYQQAWKSAVAVWGRTGSVRSAVLLGFEEEETFAAGIELLCQLGVAPMLSVFRPATGTPLESYMPPDEALVWALYRRAQSICSTYDLALGPLCPACQNNTVCLTML